MTAGDPVAAVFMPSEKSTIRSAVTGTPTEASGGFVAVTVGGVESIVNAALRTVVGRPPVSFTMNWSAAVAVFAAGTVHAYVVWVPGTGPRTAVHGAPPVAE